jgi:hypothetical protein
MTKLLRWLLGRFGLVVISQPTAEYLTILAGQVQWGDRERRRLACYELGCVKLINSLDCFQKS